jgi:DNA transformation protein
MDPDAIRDILQALGGPIHIRRMFGGQGIYQGEVMFALEASGDLYLKVDDVTVEVFRALGSRPFAYHAKDGRTATMSYWLMPVSALEDPDEAGRLAKLAIAAAWRSRSAKSRKTTAKRAPKGA